MPKEIDMYLVYGLVFSTHKASCNTIIQGLPLLNIHSTNLGSVIKIRAVDSHLSKGGVGNS
jgi:hypothetical protein